MVWDPKRISPQSWADVAEFYVRIAARNYEFRPMQLLALHVGSQPYAGALSAATSGTALFVAPAGVTDWVGEGLRVDVDFTGAIRFVREGRGARKSDMFRADSERITDAFDGFLRRSGWGIGGT
jgi:hypothetical protein